VDAEQRDALADFVRVALRSELNELARLCARVERVERELGAVAVRAGLGSPRRVGRDEEVRRLYEAGASLRAVAAVTGLDRATVARIVSDLPPPAVTVGLDGRSTRPRRRAAASANGNGRPGA
jgi:hypothetical protein